MSTARHSEAAFETVIEAHLLQNGYTPVAREGFDRERAIFSESVLARRRLANLAGGGCGRCTGTRPAPTGTSKRDREGNGD